MPDGLPDAVRVRHDLRGRREVTVAFVRSRRDLDRGTARWDRALADDAVLWVAFHAGRWGIAAT